MTKTPIIPQPVLQRLPKYLSVVEGLIRSETSWASSTDLADSLRLTSSTVRQDFAHLDLNGVAKRGYAVEELRAALKEALVESRKLRVVIVGAGHLGIALCAHGQLESRGFAVAAIFDGSPDVVGTTIGSLVVQPLKQLRSTIRRKNVKIGIITVPLAAAQEVADKLLDAGIEGLLNLTYAHIRAPGQIPVTDVRLVDSLQQLAYAIRTSSSDQLGDQDQFSLDGAQL